MKALLVPAVLLAVLPAVAGAASHDLETFITEHDLNNDGSVSKEEFEEARKRQFAATDADHDGGLSHDEYVGEYRQRLLQRKPDAKTVERQMKQAEVRFGVLDSNHDGKISTAEYAHSGWSMFTHHDYTKDGAVSLKDKVDPDGKKPAGPEDHSSSSS